MIGTFAIVRVINDVLPLRMGASVPSPDASPPMAEYPHCYPRTATGARLEERRPLSCPTARTLASPGLAAQSMRSLMKAVMIRHVCRMGLEGIRSKGTDAPYRGTSAA